MNCLSGTDLIVVHREGQNYTITYGELLEHIESYLNIGDAKLKFVSQGDELISVYSPSKPVPTEIEINNSKIQLRHQDGTKFAHFYLNQDWGQWIDFPEFGEKNVQSDWDETDATSAAFIKNKPDDTKILKLEVAELRSEIEELKKALE